MRGIFSALAGRFDDWLTSPSPTQAGSLGLFRILFAGFYLWHLSYVFVGDFVKLPLEAWRPVLLVGALGRPPAWLMLSAEVLLVALLILLAVGLRTRFVTIGVLVVGLLVDGYHQSLGKVEHSTAFLSFYIPFLMSFSAWGEVYSLDGLRRRARGLPTVDTGSNHWRFAWPSRVALCILSFLFFTAAWTKAVNGSWLADGDVALNLVAAAEVTGRMYGTSDLPITDWIVSWEGASPLLLGAVLLFEATFFLSLLGTGMRRFYVTAALIFHSMNALILAVTFTPILITYGLFVNWEGWLDRLSGRSAGSVRRGSRASKHLTRRYLPVAAISLAAVLVGIAWTFDGRIRMFVNGFGLVDWRTIWMLVLPVVLTVPLIRFRYRFKTSDP